MCLHAGPSSGALGERSTPTVSGPHPASRVPGRAAGPQSKGVCSAHPQTRDDSGREWGKRGRDQSYTLHPLCLSVQLYMHNYVMHVSGSV